MVVATLRPDGWQQSTMVGFFHDDLTIYFSVARTSLKLANIHRDPRVSIALGHADPSRLRGLSMAAHAAEVTELEEVGRLQSLMLARYPGETVFSPRQVSATLIRATPIVVSVIDLARGTGEPDLVTLDNQTSVHHLRNAAGEDGKPSHGGRRADGVATVLVSYTRDGSGDYRPGAPL